MHEGAYEHILVGQIKLSSRGNTFIYTYKYLIYHSGL